MTTNVSDSSHLIEQVGGICREFGGHLVNIKIDKFFSIVEIFNVINVNSTFLLFDRSEKKTESLKAKYFLKMLGHLV